jgi:arginine decarboxylase
VRDSLSGRYRLLSAARQQTESDAVITPDAIVAAALTTPELTTPDLTAPDLTTPDLTFAEPDDPTALAGRAPLFSAWLDVTRDQAAGRLTAFSIPGHKQRTHQVGHLVSGDVPLYAGLDTMQLTSGVLARAEAAAAALWQVDWCRFSVGGSTHANQAAVLAVGRPGQKVVVSRTLHRSVLTGLVLAGLVPVWVHPDVDPATGLPTNVPVAAVEAALAAHPDACAVLLGDPSYIGTVSDVAGHADAAHAAGVPLIVDGAWAAHFGFHPLLPAHALAEGADALVISAHKTLPAMNQAALLLARTTRAGGMLDAGRLELGFEAGHTTSPSGAILASIDASRALLERDGEDLLGQLITLVASARERLAAVPGLHIPAGRIGNAVLEPAKLLVQTAGAGVTATALETELRSAGVILEMAGRDTLIPMVTMADDGPSMDRLVTELIAAVERLRGPSRAIEVAASWQVTPIQAMPPREAFFAPSVPVPAAEAIGRISTELVSPYPPGIPVLAPGEVITAEAVAGLLRTREDGGRIAYAQDPTLATFQVVA